MAAMLPSCACACCVAYTCVRVRVRVRVSRVACACACACACVSDNDNNVFFWFAGDGGTGAQRIWRIDERSPGRRGSSLPAITVSTASPRCRPRPARRWMRCVPLLPSHRPGELLLLLFLAGGAPYSSSAAALNLRDFLFCSLLFSWCEGAGVFEDGRGHLGQNRAGRHRLREARRHHSRAYTRHDTTRAHVLLTR